jgi:two-component system, cell cycle sensor histidine kinase and response regulator CckA
MKDADRSGPGDGAPASDQAVDRALGACTCENGRRYREELRASEERFRALAESETLGMLAGGVAHDFNNMLSVILTYTDFLLGALAQGELHADAEVVRRAAESAADLTRQLLALSHPQVLRPVVLDLAQVVAGMKRMLGRVLAEDIQLVVSESPSDCFIFADPGQIERVILNLAVNARDAMPRGGRLTIETVKLKIDPAPGTDEAGPYVALIVADTGVGMHTETRRRIFEPFFTTKKEGEGTGLGLPICRSIVRSLGGEISVQSQPGRTTFRVELPAAASPRNAPEPDLSVRLGRRPRVLIADDNPSLRRVLSVTLGSRCDLELVENGRQAIKQLLESRAYDVVLCDLAMPDMNGREVFEALQAARPGLEKTLSFMTAGVSTAAARDFLAHVPNRCFEKPFDFIEVIERILRDDGAGTGERTG